MILLKKTISSSKKRKHRYKLDYFRNTLSSSKMQKSNEQFKSCYCNTPFDYCLTCVSGFCHTHQTIKCTGECQRVFHITCSDIVNNEPINNRKKNDSSCFEIYSSVDKNKLFNTTWLCAKCKYTLYDMIESPNIDYL